MVGLGIYGGSPILLHQGRKELISQVTTDQGPLTPAECLTWVWVLQLIIFPSKHFIGLIETFIRDNETPRSTWISPELRILKPFMVWVPSPKLVSVSVNMSAVSVSQVAALQRTN